MLTHPESYLAHILRASSPSETLAAEAPWEHPSVESASQQLRDWLHDARLFSLVQQGATLLYNHMLAEALEDDEAVERFSGELATWSHRREAPDLGLEQWDRAAMWERLLRANPRLRRRTREFADHWYELAAASGELGLADRREARRLVRDRERELKGARARLTYREARDRRRGYPVSTPLLFRWPQVQTITTDILDGLGVADA